MATLMVAAGMVFLSSVRINFPFKFLTVMSGSMEPRIKLGSVVVVAKRADYNVDEVVTFRSGEFPSQTITHKIITAESREDGKKVFTTKGESNNDADSQKIGKESIVGKVIFVVPYIGFLVGFIKTPAGSTLLIIIPGVLFIANEIINIRTELTKISGKVRYER